MKEVIKEYLKDFARKEKPVSSVDLAFIYNLRGKEIRDIIHDLRVDGVPICSCSRGYYYSEDKEDIERVANSLYERMKSIEEARNGLMLWLYED